jgi:hypothetical protein
MDPVLIALYRLTGHPVADYLTGTFFLAILTSLVGEVTVWVVRKVNGAYLGALADRARRYNDLSEAAGAAGDRAAYKACNREANDAFGEFFFNKFGVTAASLWPVFFALAWMQERFGEIRIPIPWTGLGAGYVVVFLLAYVLARVLLWRIRCALPVRGGRSRLLD